MHRTLCQHYALNYVGGRVVHSYGRLIPHEFPITDLQQISGPDVTGKITCTARSGIVRFAANSGKLESEGVSQSRTGATATLVVNPSNVRSFQNRDLYCTKSRTTFFYLFISSASKYTSLSCKVATVITILWYCRSYFIYIYICMYILCTYIIRMQNEKMNH